MNTADSIFLFITAASLSLFFLLASCLLIYVWITYHQLIKRTQSALDGLEEARKMIQEVSNGKTVKMIYKILKYLAGGSKGSND